MARARRKVSDGLARTVRGGGQGSVAYALDVMVDSFWHMTNDQFGAVLILLTVAVAAAQNAIENRIGKAFLRNVPARPAKVPVVDEAPPKPKRRRS